MMALVLSLAVVAADLGYAVMAWRAYRGLRSDGAASFKADA